MKVAVLLACTCAIFTPTLVKGAAIQAPLDVISLDDISETDRKHLEYLNRHYPRPKRSGSEDILYSLTAGIKNKLGQIAKGSVSASGGLSKGSSAGSSGHGYHHDVPEFDLWSLKKSILNTLLQAVKAIKGGVIAIKGQLIKGSGYLVSAKGKLISTKGELISNIGKNIASSAMLSPHPHHGPPPDHEEYVHFPPHPSGLGGEYGSHSAPGPEYEVPEHHPSPHHEDKSCEPQAGILIIKKIPHTGRGQSSHATHEDEKVPPFKPLKPSEPSFAQIVGKFFSASTSLKPGEPAPFGYTSPGHDSYHDTLHHLDHNPNHYHSSHYDEHNEHSSSSSHEGHHGDGTAPEYLPPPQHSSDSSEHLGPPSSNYGAPFEEAPSYLNEDEEYASASKNSPQTSSADSNKSHAVEPRKPNQEATTPHTYDEIRPLAAAIAQSYPSGEPAHQHYQLPTSQAFDEIRPLSIASSANGFDQTYLNNAYKNSLPVPSKTPLSYDLLNTQSYYGGFQNPVSSDLSYLSAPSSGPSVFPQRNGLNSFNSHSLPSTPHKHHNVRSNFVSQKSHVRPHPSKSQSHLLPQSHDIYMKRPTGSRTASKVKKSPTYDVVRSIGYELGPHGPKRL